MNSYAGKVVVITGASSGIGAALAREMARRGAHLVLTARRLDRLESLAAELRTGERQVLAVAADVTRDGDLDKVVDAARAQLGGLDVVVANAGISVNGPMASLGVEQVRRQLEINLFGVLRTFYATRASLLERRGVLAIVGSVAGFVATPGSVAYSLSKFAVRGLAEGLAAELYRDGVAVVHIAPGFVASESRSRRRPGSPGEKGRDPVPPWLQMPLAQAASEIADAIAQRRARKVLTRHGKLAVALSQYAPALVDAVLRRAPAGSRRRREKP
jgi:short-subunit dehydrogenase